MIAAYTGVIESEPPEMGIIIDTAPMSNIPLATTIRMDFDIRFFSFQVWPPLVLDGLACLRWNRKGTNSATAKPSEKKHFGIPLSVFGQVP